MKAEETGVQIMLEKEEVMLEGNVNNNLSIERIWSYHLVSISIKLPAHCSMKFYVMVVLILIASNN